MYHIPDRKERYQEEAAQNLARFAKDGVTLLVGDAPERYPLRETFRDIFVRPAVRGDAIFRLRRLRV